MSVLVSLALMQMGYYEAARVVAGGLDDVGEGENLEIGDWVEISHVLK